MSTPKIQVLKTNMTVLYTDDYTILYSYNTPVACYSIQSKKYYRTSEFHSITTSKHINQWLNGKDFLLASQWFFEHL